MELTDILNILHTGKEGAILLLVWFVWQAAKQLVTALETLQDIKQVLVENGTESKESHATIIHKLDDVHEEVSKFPLKIIRSKNNV